MGLWLYADSEGFDSLQIYIYKDWCQTTLEFATAHEELH